MRTVFSQWRNAPTPNNAPKVATQAVSGCRQDGGKAICADSPMTTKVVAMASPAHSRLR
jgi:hypothetical protein